MAVFTQITEEQLCDFLDLYNIGQLVRFTEIAEGVENSNYLVTTTQTDYILTLFEKRVAPEDLPYYFSLMQHLKYKGLAVASVISDKFGEHLHILANRPAAIIEFLPGTATLTPSPQACAQLGALLAKFHLYTMDFNLNKNNDLSVTGWQRLRTQCAPDANRLEAGLFGFLADEYDYIAPRWPEWSDLPMGAIHADLFPDNVLFENGKITGIIDFYFACSDFYIYDLAVCILSWCFDERHHFSPRQFKNMLASYQQVRPLTKPEKQAMSLMCRGAGLRFLLTRLYDWIHQDKQALVTVKNPLEYKHKIEQIRAGVIESNI
ncbi:MAG: homoserine kinase [bacterium]